jgi:hypothetical protein
MSYAAPQLLGGWKGGGGGARMLRTDKTKVCAGAQGSLKGLDCDVSPKLVDIFK